MVGLECQGVNTGAPFSYREMALVRGEQKQRKYKMYSLQFLSSSFLRNKEVLEKTIDPLYDSIYAPASNRGIDVEKAKEIDSFMDDFMAIGKKYGTR